MRKALSILLAASLAAPISLAYASVGWTALVVFSPREYCPGDTATIKEVELRNSGPRTLIVEKFMVKIDWEGAPATALSLPVSPPVTVGPGGRAVLPGPWEFQVPPDAKPGTYEVMTGLSGLQIMEQKESVLSEWNPEPDGTIVVKECSLLGGIIDAIRDAVFGFFDWLRGVLGLGP